MSDEEAILSLLRALRAASIPCVLVGSLASSAYGIPRSTKDADIVLNLEGRSIAEMTPHLPPPLRLDPQLSFEGVTGTYKALVHVEGSDFEFELFFLSEDEHDQERFRRKRTVKRSGIEVDILTAEDVIISKLRWLQRIGRGKDRDDIHDVIAVQRDRLDWDYIHSWCDRHGTRALLDEIRASIPTQ